MVELLPLFAEHRPAAELDFVAFQSQNFDQDLVAFLQLIADVAYAVLGDLADVQQPIGSREDLDERAEIHQPDHRPQVRLPHLGRSRQVRNNLERLLGRRFIRRSHVDRSIVLDIDLDAGLLDDSADDLAAGSDDVSDLVGRNLQGVDARRVLRHGGPRLRDRLVHLVENEQPAPARLLQSFLHEGRGHVGDLDVHLQRRNARARAGHFEIHIAVMILGAGDVGQDGVLIAFLHQAHGHAAHVRRQRHARIHQG